MRVLTFFFVCVCMKILLNFHGILLNWERPKGADLPGGDGGGAPIERGLGGIPPHYIIIWQGVQGAEPLRWVHRAKPLCWGFRGEAHECDFFFSVWIDFFYMLDV